MRQLADEPDRVGQDEPAAAFRLHQTRGRIEGHEELIRRSELRARQAIEQGRLSRVRVTDERDDRNAGAAPPLTLQPPMHLHAVELPANLHHLPSNRPAVGLELGLARSARADAAPQPLEVRPLADEPRQQVGELRELDLQLALARARALGEDVEDQRRPVDDLDAEHLGDVALLDRRERIVGDEEHRGGLARRLPDLVDLAAAEEEPRRRRGPVLRDPAHDGAAGRGHQPRQLFQRLVDLEPALRGSAQRGDHRALPRRPGTGRRSLHPSPPRRANAAAIRSAVPSAPPAFSTSIHSMPGSRENQVHCRLA